MTGREKSIDARGESEAEGVPQDRGAQKTEERGGVIAAPKTSTGRNRRAGKPRTSKPHSAKHKAATPKKAEPFTGRGVMRRAYKNLSEKLETQKDASKAIDDLVKLVKLEKDWGGDKKGVKEIKVRWEQEKDKSSSEK